MTDENPFAADAPGTALAKVDDLKAEFVFIPGNMDALLMDIRVQALAEVAGLDISTPKMRKQFKDTANKVVKSRTFIERLRVGYVSAEKKRLATVDAEAKRIKEILQGIEEEVREPLTAWENAEETRVNGRMEAIKEVTNAGTYTQANWMTLSIETMQDRLREIEENAQEWQEFSVPAAQAKQEAVRLIKEAIAKREVYDREQAELAKLRAEAAAREQQGRIDSAARIAREHAEQEAARQAEIDRRKIEDAEERARQAELTAKRDQEQAVENERMRVAVEAKREREAAEARAADDANRENIHAEIAYHLVQECGMDPEMSDEIVEAISKGLIPHLRIEY